MHGVTSSPFFGFSIRKVCLLIIILIYFKVSFIQSCLTSTGNLVTYKNLLDLVWNGTLLILIILNQAINYLIILPMILKTLFKPFPISFSESYAPLYSRCACLITSRIFNLASLILIFGCTWFPSQIISITSVLIDLSS